MYALIAPIEDSIGPLHQDIRLYLRLWLYWYTYKYEEEEDGLVPDIHYSSSCLLYALYAPQPISDSHCIFFREELNKERYATIRISLYYH